MQIELRDYNLAITKARAQVTEAHSRLLQEKGNVKAAQKGWEMIDEGKPTPLALGMPKLEEARAKFNAAKGALKEALLNRE